MPWNRLSVAASDAHCIATIDLSPKQAGPLRISIYFNTSLSGGPHVLWRGETLCDLVAALGSPWHANQKGKPGWLENSPSPRTRLHSAPTQAKYCWMQHFSRAYICPTTVAPGSAGVASFGSSMDNCWEVKRLNPGSFMHARHGYSRTRELITINSRRSPHPPVRSSASTGWHRISAA